MRRIPVLTLLLMVLLSPSASASDGGILQGCLMPEDQIQVFVSGPWEETPEAGAFSASLGGEAVPVIRAASAAAQPVTYYCLTDVSGSMTADQLTREKEVLRAICGRLATGDRMVIGRMGGSVVPTAYLWDKSAIGAEIDALEIRNEDPDLYGGIADALQELTTSNNATARKCLTLLSCGADAGGRSREETVRAVREARIPVYAVAVPSASSVADAQGADEILGGLARASAGGLYQSLDGIGASECGTAIADALRRDLLLTLDLSGLSRSLLSRDRLLLQVRATTEDASYEDAVEIDPSRLTLSERARGLGDGDPTFWIRIVIAGVLLLAALILLLTGRKRPEAPPSPAPSESSTAGGVPDRGRVPPGDTGRGNVPGGAGGAAPYRDRGNVSGAGGAASRERSGASGAAPYRDRGASPYRAPAGRSPRPPEDGRTVTFTAIGYEGIRYQIRIPGGRSVTLGRDRRADRILNAEDPRLSGVHFQAELAGDRLRIRDAGSTNGTAVDGVPLSPGGSALAGEGQTLRAGSYEYRIHLDP